MTLHPLLDHDLHVHSTFSDGKDSLADNVAAAEAAGLTTLGLVDHVRSDTTWVPGFLDAVAALGSETPVRLLAGVEAKLLDTTGAVDAPVAAANADFVALADHVVPLAGGAVHPAEVRTMLEEGRISRQAVVHDLIVATLQASARYERVLIAHLFSVLPKAGLDESDIDDHLVRAFARGLARNGAVVEVSERWRCPSRRVVCLLRAEGVRIVASTDSHRASTIGRYDYAAWLFRPLSGWDPEDAVRPLAACVTA